MSNWTVMVYLAGDNNLSEEMIWTIKEIQAANLGDNTVAVQFDPRGGSVPVQRYLIKKGQQHQSLYEIARTVPEVESSLPAGMTYAAKLEMLDSGLKQSFPLQPNVENTGDPGNLLSFVCWAAQQGRGDNNLMLVLSGHGCGFEDGYLMSDENPRGSLTIGDLARTSEAVYSIFQRGIDILGMDSCLMSTAEMYYELQGNTKYLVASEGYALNSGWPYRKMLSGLPATPRAAAEKLVEDHIRFYYEYALAAQSVDLSACSTERRGELQWVVFEFSTLLRRAIERPELRNAIVLAHWSAQSYKSDQYVDIVDFADELKRTLLEAGIAGLPVKEWPDHDSQPAADDLPGSLLQQCDKIRNVIAGRDDDSRLPVVLSSGYCGPAFQFSHGLSVYFPWSNVAEQYRDLRFGNDTGWHGFLVEYVNRTRRVHRAGGSLEGVLSPNREDPRRNRRRSYPGGASRFRQTPPDDKGIYQSFSMKNPPLGWRRCPLLEKAKPKAEWPV